MSETVPTTVESLFEDEVINLSTPTLERLLSLDSDAFALYVFYCYTAKKQSIAIRRYTNSIKANEPYCKQGLGWGGKKYHKAKNILLKENIIEDLVKRNKEGKVEGHYILIHYLKNHLAQNQRVEKEETGSQAQNHPTPFPQGGFQTTNTIDLDLNTIDSTNVKNGKGLVRDTANAVKSAKNALLPCTPLELWTIAVNLNIGLSYVRDKHEQILDLVESGQFQKKKYGTTVYHTLRTWLRMGKENGKIPTLDEMGRMSLQGDHPDEIAKRKRLWALAERNGVI